ncbi:MAG TPA: hypothetical protein PLP01_06375 [Phycisphaerae bacterium]|nr:hypothetical protein [Phycisphaerae bacterium]HOI54856.1 hypothetical protein [Phycisphaerae bacterium]
MKALVVVLVVVGVLGVLVAVSAMAQESRPSGSSTIALDVRDAVVEFTSEAGGDPLRASRCRVKVMGDWVQIDQRGDNTIFIPRRSIKTVTTNN